MDFDHEHHVVTVESCEWMLEGEPASGGAFVLSQCMERKESSEERDRVVVVHGYRPNAASRSGT